MRKSTRSELEQVINEVHIHNMNLRNREVYLHSVHNSDGEPGIEYQMATMFIKNIHLLCSQGDGTILVHMHTRGGEWYDGMAMFNTIRFSTAPVVIVAYGQASSMSGILLQAADKRILMPDCEFMVHFGSLALDDNSLAAYSAVQANERTCRRMLEIFARRARTGRFFKKKKYSEAQIIRFLDRRIKNKSDWYLPADEAVDFGMADGILGDRGFESFEKIKQVDKYKGGI